MDQEAIDDLAVTSMKKIHVNKKRKLKKNNQVKLTFASVADRDLVFGHAANLPDGFAVDITVPDHLLPLRRHLETFAFKVRKFSREISGLKVSTSIRFEDDSRSLVLSCKEEGDDEWKSYTREELENLTPGLEPIDAEENKNGGSSDDGGEEDANDEDKEMS